MYLQSSYLAEASCVDFEYEKAMIRTVETVLKGYQYLENCCEVSQPSYRRWLFEELKLTPHSKVLDYGCTISHFWVKNSKHLDSSIDYHLIEPSKIGMRLSQKYLNKLDQKVTLEQMDLLHLNYESASFDTILSECAFLLLDKNKQTDAIHEVSRVLKPGGTFYALVAIESHLDMLERLNQQLRCQTDKDFDKPMNPIFLAAEGSLFKSINVKKHKTEYLIKDCRTFINLIFNFNSTAAIRKYAITKEQMIELNQRVQKVIDEKGGILLERYFYVAVCEK